MRTIDLLGHLTDDDRAGRIDQLLQLPEMVVDGTARARTFERSADEQSTLDRLLDENGFAADAQNPRAVAWISGRLLSW
jgi:hypothetical protein